MSAGELESGNAGEPAKLIRQRYREVRRRAAAPRGDGDGEEGGASSAGHAVGPRRASARDGSSTSGRGQADQAQREAGAARTRRWVDPLGAHGLTLAAAAGHIAQASDVIKKGKMCSLFINDLDAGAGRMGDSTQYTVNNQMVNATLMNIADNPTNVQLPGVYKNEEIPRVPVVCTGNDFSTLYAPLIRDGRMEK